MRFSGNRSSMRIFLGLWLLHQLAPAAAGAAHGALTVSMTVLSSCEVRADSGASFGVAGVANQGPADAATVTCPVAYPFRASLAYGAATGFVESGGDAGLVFTGARRVELSQLSGAADRGVANGMAQGHLLYARTGGVPVGRGVAWLTISY
jgi:hypothetical protein